MSAQTTIAALGLVLAIVSLVWQAITYTRSGSRFAVDIHFGALGPGGLVRQTGTGPPDFARLAAQGFTEPVIIATVRNIGRLSGTVVSWSIDNGPMAYVPTQNLIGENVPLRIDHEDKRDLVVELSPIRATVDINADVLGERSRDVRAVIETASGKKISSAPLTIP